MGKRDPRRLDRARVTGQGIGYLLYTLRDVVPEAGLLDNRKSSPLPVVT